MYYALKDNNMLSNYDVYTFDITEPVHDKQYKLNLAQDNLINIFNLCFPKPEIILSSPLCQSFSRILSMKGGGTCFWKLNEAKDKLVFRSTEEFERLKAGFTRNLKADTQKFLAILGKKCIDNTIDLIKHYQPKYWYIENPKTSLMWKYITLNRNDFYHPDFVYFNEANYMRYGFLSSKPTYFLSNIKMNLKTGKTITPYTITKDSEGNHIYILKDNPNIKIKVFGKNLKTPYPARTAKFIDINKLKNNSSGVIKMKKPTQKTKTTDLQFSESGYTTSIPSNLIKEIFEYFEGKK